VEYIYVVNFLLKITQRNQINSLYEQRSPVRSRKNYAIKYLDELPVKRAFPDAAALNELEKLSIKLPGSATDSQEVLETLNRIGSPNTVASNGGRYFGFVFGGSLPAALAANWLAAAWDQNAVFKVSSPIAAKLEDVAGDWLLNLLQLPPKSAVGFVTGTTMANFCGVLAARHSIWERKGWNSKAKGINGAPPIRLVVGEEIHASMLRALLFAGFGTDNLIRVPTDEQGRMIAEKMPELNDSTLVCVQAGNVNTGAIDPIKDICSLARKKVRGYMLMAHSVYGPGFLLVSLHWSKDVILRTHGRSTCTNGSTYLMMPD
jgi:glutamate/tyrosine decarboxylase-like PLP-dependent enzyme